MNIRRICTERVVPRRITCKKGGSQGNKKTGRIDEGNWAFQSMELLEFSYRKTIQACYSVTIVTPII